MLDANAELQIETISIEADADDAAIAPGPAVTRPGDVWKGSHQLLLDLGLRENLQPKGDLVYFRDQTEVVIAEPSKVVGHLALNAVRVSQNLFQGDLHTNEIFALEQTSPKSARSQKRTALICSFAPKRHSVKRDRLAFRGR